MKTVTNSNAPNAYMCRAVGRKRKITDPATAQSMVKVRTVLIRAVRLALVGKKRGNE